MAILASASGALKTIKEECSVGPSVSYALDVAMNMAHHAISRYPSSPGGETTAEKVRQERKDGDWIVERMRRWKAEIEKVPKQWEYFVLISIAYQSIVDLAGKIRDQRKLALLEPMLGPIKEISDFSDPGGTNFEAYECAAATLQALYDVIGFRP
jgi:hypothetical protein